MKKLFTLLTLALISIGSAWGQTTETIFSWTGSSERTTGVASESNDYGTITAYSGEGSSTTENMVNVSQSSNYVLKCQGKADFTTSVIKVVLKSGVKLQKGDVLTVNGFSNNNSKDSYPSFKFSSTYTETFSTTAFANMNSSSSNYNSGNLKDAQQITLGEGANDVTEFLISRGSTSTNFFITSVTITRTETRVISTQAFAGVKEGSTTLTETTDYTVEENVITLTDAHKALTAPENIKLINHITYTDDTTKDEDVDVEFDGTVTGGYFIGTATINETEYNVKVKKDVTPTLEATPTAISVVSARIGTGSATISLVGGNLTGEASVTWASDVAGLTITPTTFTVDGGEVNQEFTVSYQSNEDVAEATVNLTFAVGLKSVVVPVTYSSTAAVTEITNIGTVTSFSWNNITPKSQVDQSENELILANVASLDFTEFGDASAIKLLKVQRPMYKSGSDWCAQAHGFAINTSIPGVLTIKFGGTNTNTRTITIDGEEFGSVNSTDSKTASVYIPAGEHTIMGYEGENSNNLRYYEINFEGLVAADEVTITDAGYATVVLSKDAYFDATPGVTAYAAKANGETIQLTEVKAAPAETPLVIKGAADSYQLYKATTAPAEVSTDINDLVAGPVTGNGTSYYVLGKEGSKVGFGLLKSGVVLPATKAYIPASKFTESRAFFAIDGDATAIKNIKVGSEDNIYYDLQGRRILYPTKGLYIVNGKKVILK